MTNRSRYFNNTLDTEQVTETLLRSRFSETIKWCTGTIQQRQGISGSSVYTGSCGVALMLYRISKLVKRDPSFSEAINFTRKELLQDALKLSSKAVTQFHRQRTITFLEGLAGCLAVKAVIAAALDPASETAAVSLRELLHIATYASKLPSQECEVLYGRCGYLCALHFVRRELNKPHYGSEEAQAILVQVLQEGLREARRLDHQHMRLFYRWHDHVYLGAAHGIIGILNVLMLFSGEWDDVEKRIPQLDFRGIWGLILDSIVAILKYYTSPAGYVSSSCERQRSDDDALVHWCHGSPGLILLLCTLIRSKYPSSEDHTFLLGAIVKLGSAVWERGLLLKGLGLCHGIGGNAIALLRLSQVVPQEDSTIWVRRAQKFALFGCDNLTTLESTPDRPDSLFEGLSGFVWCLCDCLTPDEANFPGMD